MKKSIKAKKKRKQTTYQLRKELNRVERTCEDWRGLCDRRDLRITELELDIRKVKEDRGSFDRRSSMEAISKLIEAQAHLVGSAAKIAVPQTF